MSERLLIAFHEAGHAVAQVRLGFTCLGATILNRGEYIGDAAEAASDNMQTVCFAGYCAEIEAGQLEAIALEHAANDFEQAEIRRIGRGAVPVTQGEGLEPTFAFVRDQWQAIGTVAAELILRGQLDGNEIAIIVKIVDGEAYPEDLAQYRMSRTTLECICEITPCGPGENPPCPVHYPAPKPN